MRIWLEMAICAALVLTSCKPGGESKLSGSLRPGEDIIMSETLSRDDDRRENPSLKEEFKELLREWNKHLRSHEVEVSARLDVRFDCEAYHKIVGLGQDALPLIIEEMRRGNHFLYRAARDITGLTVDDIKKELAAEGIFPDDRIRNGAILYSLWWDMKTGKPD